MASADMDDLQCGLCLNTYKTPKFLPCFHTYCEDCLDNLVKTTPDNPHKCPKCRTEFKLPAGGVRELQSNFYLTPLLSPERCTLHRTETLRFYCTDCTVPICLNCRMTDHFKHEAQDLGKVLDAARKELKNNQERLNECDESLTSKLNDLQRKRSHVTERTEILKVMVDERCKQLKRKFNTMVAESKRAVLEKLETTSGKLKRPFLEKEDCVNQRQITVRGQLREVTQALENNNGCSLLNISVDLRDGRNIPQVDDDSLPTSTRSVLYYKPLCSADIKRDIIEPFLGQLKQIEAIPLQEPISDPYVIDIGENQQLYVHAVLVDCDASGDTFVCVAYSWTPKDVMRSCVAWFRQDTKNLLHKSEEPIKGRVGLGGLNKGWVRVEGKNFPAKDMSLQKSSTAGNNGAKRRYDVYNKGHARFVLRVHSGLCDLRAVTITGDTDTADFKVWEVSAKTPIAMDVSRDGQLMAVLEEGVDHVMLYRLGNKDPHVTYRGNGEAFRPLDVCFYMIGGEERLVIADWLNDVLHVVEVGESCTLIGHVGGELPQLAKPTALCVDKKGRLWVGCVGGHVLRLNIGRTCPEEGKEKFNSGGSDSEDSEQDGSDSEETDSQASEEDTPVTTFEAEHSPQTASETP